MSKFERADKERLEVLLSRQFLSVEEMAELQENPFVIEAEYIGHSNSFEGYYWYDVKVCQDGCLPSDSDCLTDRYDIYEKIENEE